MDIQQQVPLAMAFCCPLTLPSLSSERERGKLWGSSPSNLLTVTKHKSRIKCYTGNSARIERVRKSAILYSKAQHTVSHIIHYFLSN